MVSEIEVLRTPEDHLNEAYDHGFVLDEFFNLMNDVIFEWRELKHLNEGMVERWAMNRSPGAVNPVYETTPRNEKEHAERLARACYAEAVRILVPAEPEATEPDYIHHGIDIPYETGEPNTETHSVSSDSRGNP